MIRVRNVKVIMGECRGVNVSMVGQRRGDGFQARGSDGRDCGWGDCGGRHEVLDRASVRGGEELLDLELVEVALLVGLAGRRAQMWPERAGLLLLVKGRMVVVIGWKPMMMMLLLLLLLLLLEELELGDVVVDGLAVQRGPIDEQVRRRDHCGRAAGPDAGVRQTGVASGGHGPWDGVGQILGRRADGKTGADARGRCCRRIRALGVLEHADQLRARLRDQHGFVDAHRVRRREQPGIDCSCASGIRTGADGKHLIRFPDCFGRRNHALSRLHRALIITIFVIIVMRTGRSRPTRNHA